MGERKPKNLKNVLHMSNNPTVTTLVRYLTHVFNFQNCRGSSSISVLCLSDHSTKLSLQFTNSVSQNIADKLLNEVFEDTKGVIRSNDWKDRQYYDLKNNEGQTILWPKEQRRTDQYYDLKNNEGQTILWPKEQRRTDNTMT